MKKVLVIILFLPALLFGQNVDSIFIKKISDDILTNGNAYEWLHFLTKKIGHRLTASPSFYKAVYWGKDVLTHLKADDVFLQAATAVHWVRGEGDKVEIVALNNQQQNIFLQALALGNSLAGNAEAEVIALNNFDELEQQKEAVKNKIVFFNFPFNPALITPSHAYGETGKYRYNGASMAAKYGAKGCLIRSLSGSTDNFPHTGVMKYNDSFAKIPALALGLKDADKLWQLCQKNKVKIALATHGKFLQDTTVYNVIGEMRGQDNQKIITIGGHLDSWDVGEGAHDDGTGIVQTMQVLQAFKNLGYKPKHTIRFVLFANEENGSAGGKQYAKDALQKNEKHIFALETDAGGFTPRGFNFNIPDSLKKLVISFQNLLQPYGSYIMDVNGGGGVDIGPLNEKLNTPVSGFIPDNQRYFDYHHTDNDVFENVNKRELLLGAVNIAALIYLVDKYFE